MIFNLITYRYSLNNDEMENILSPRLWVVQVLYNYREIRDGFQKKKKKFDRY